MSIGSLERNNRNLLLAVDVRHLKSSHLGIAFHRVTGIEIRWKLGHNGRPQRLACCVAAVGQFSVPHH